MLPMAQTKIFKNIVLYLENIIQRQNTVIKNQIIVYFILIYRLSLCGMLF